MRATAFDQEAALAQGISARRVHGLSWALSAAIATIAGVLLSSGSHSLSPGVGNIALLAFPAIILGGLDSTTGAVVGGLIIGIVQQMTTGYAPLHATWMGANADRITPYVVMVVVLMLRPYGLFGTREVRRV